MYTNEGSGNLEGSIESNNQDIQGIQFAIDTFSSDEYTYMIDERGFWNYHDPDLNYQGKYTLCSKRLCKQYGLDDSIPEDKAEVDLILREHLQDHAECGQECHEKVVELKKMLPGPITDEDKAGFLRWVHAMRDRIIDIDSKHKIVLYTTILEDCQSIIIALTSKTPNKDALVEGLRNGLIDSMHSSSTP